MMDVIQLLPDSVANQIAAGEVIQRPASVIKELVENAVDAGATDIRIILRDGGKTLIQVIDNGSGMSDTDARLAFERHATSKISKAADLFDLHTMGFRGEALPSIAAVAQIDLRTRREYDTVGTHLQIAASKFESQEAAMCACGTNISVKNLFFNFPARRKFLKKDSVELTHIIHEFERLALVNPDKSFTLIHNDINLHQLGAGSLKKRILDLFGKALDRQLIPVATETSLVKIEGFVSHPENARKRGALKYFFVNGRNMVHPYFQKAVMTCFENLIPADYQPSFFLDFKVDPSTIDVNIHPTKSEIKFENEAPIWQILVAAIKEALGKFNAVPSMDFDSADSIDIPVFNPKNTLDISDAPLMDYNPFTASKKSGSSPSSGTSRRTMPWENPQDRTTLNNWDKLYEDFNSASEAIAPSSPSATTASSGFSVPQGDLQPSKLNNGTEPDSTATPDESNLTRGLLPEMDDAGDVATTTMLQFGGKYLVVPSRAGMMVIDRTRAHVKVLYERFIQSIYHALESQQVLFPETLMLTPAQNVTMEEIAPDARQLGFDLSYLGDNVWAINAIPAAINNLNPVETLMMMIADVAEQTQTASNSLRSRLALAMARAAAIKPGNNLSEAEAENLLSAFFSLPDPAFTPDGLPTFFTLDLQEVAKRLS